jgi:hypothetical protein
MTNARLLCGEAEPPEAGDATGAVGRQHRWSDRQGQLHFFVNLERIDQNRGITINIPARPDLNFTDVHA